MQNQLDLETARAFLADNFAPWVLDLRPELISCENGAARIDIPITNHIKRVGDIVCGQTMGALADTTMVFACFSHMKKFAAIATTTLDTQFLRPASGDKLSCSANIERAGKAIFFLHANIFTYPNSKLVARSTATFFRPS